MKAYTRLLKRRRSQKQKTEMQNTILISQRHLHRIPLTNGELNGGLLNAQSKQLKNLTLEAKTIIRDSGAKIIKTDALKLSHLAPQQQDEAASRLAASEIYSIVEYQLDKRTLAQQTTNLYILSSRHYVTQGGPIVNLKRRDKDCSYTPDTLLADRGG